jgi:hypothetical protein
MSFSPPSKGKRREKAKGGKEKKGSDGQLFETNGKKKRISLAILFPLFPSTPSPLLSPQRENKRNRFD